MSKTESKSSSSSLSGVVLRGKQAGHERVLTSAALGFLAELHRKFEPTRQQLLQARRDRQKQLDKGVLPTFLKSTAKVRAGDWTVAPIAADLQDRRVEITGPPDRKMVINALNSGARVFMADFEDSCAPTWSNLMEGQANLMDAIERKISLSAGGKEYKLNADESKIATLMVRPRGWHLDEGHFVVDGKPMSGALFDFGLYFFHNAKKLVERGSGPYFYLPKMESHREARLWNEVFKFSQQRLGMKQGTVRATVLIETIMAAFEMDEILFELKEHSAGLNCGRWDYIFSFIKKFRTHKDKVLPDRSQVTMVAPWMAAYVRLLIQTCHKRGIHAMGGMSAHIPVKGDSKANEAAFSKVRGDKLREVKAGCDGTWVAHPGLIPVAMETFDKYMPEKNQIGVVADTTPVAEQDLLFLGPKGTITEAGIASNISVGLAYLESWLRGVGCVPFHNLMEDAATAEISRCQIWQWLKHGAKTDTGVKIDKKLIAAALQKEVKTLEAESAGEKGRHWTLALTIYQRMLFAPELPDFLTTEAYPHIVTLLQQADAVAQLRSKL